MNRTLRALLCASTTSAALTLSTGPALAAEPPATNALPSPYGLMSPAPARSVSAPMSTSDEWVGLSDGTAPATGRMPALCDPAPSSRLYGGMDYLLWWVKGAPLSVPLVSTGPIGTTHHGLLGPPAENGADSTVLYGAPHFPAQGGNDIQNFPGFSGSRLTLGFWLDDEQRLGIEGSGFLLQRRSIGYQTRGSATGNPILGIPVLNSTPYTIGPMTILPGEDSLPFSLPSDASRVRGNDGVITGGVKISNDLRLWGYDATGVVSLLRTSSFELTGLAGFRYLDLAESLNLTADIEGVNGRYTGQSGVVSDTFQTRNQFYGGLVGLRGRYIAGPLSIDVTGRVAMGDSHEVLNIWGGFQSRNFTAPVASGPEGVFAQPANEGRTSASRFAVVPEVQFKLGYAVTPWMRATVGYDFLYYSNVLRPGDQINRQLPKGQTFNQADPVISTTSPTRLFNTTDFYANGVSVGIDFRY